MGESPKDGFEKNDISTEPREDRLRRNTICTLAAILKLFDKIIESIHVISNSLILP